MKKTFYLFCLLGFILTCRNLNAQSPFTLNPQSQCYSAGSNTAIAYVSNPVPGASSYSWSVSSPSTCVSSISTFSNGAIASLTFPCCGVYLVTLTAYNPNNVLISTSTQSAVVFCSGGVAISGNLNICAGSSTTLTASGSTTYTWMLSNGMAFSGSSVVLTPSVTTCYTVVGVTGGCVSYAAGCVNVTNGTNIAINGNANICSGSTILYASGGTSYTWMPGGSNSPSIVVSPTATTCYTLFGYGCSGLGAAVKCVTAGVAPVISISGNTAVCAGTGATLTASGASSYTWFTSMGTFTGSTIVLTPSATTCYSLMGSSGQGCTGYTGGCISVTPGSNVSISGNLNICSGQSTILTATGFSLTWQPGGSHSSSIIVTPSVTTCYTLTGIGCTGVVSVVKCVTVNPTPIISISGNTAICSGQSATLTASGATNYTWSTSYGNFTGSTIVLTPSTSTCYSIMAYNGPGCYAYSGGCINVSPGGNVAISGNANICSGNSTILYASGATSYTWIPGSLTSPSIVVSPSSTTCYTLFGSGGCNGGISSAVKCVTVNANLPITISGNTAVCAGSGATLTASGATSYTWYTSMGTFTGSTIVLTPSATTCYSLIASNNNGCMGYSGGCVSVGGSPVLSVSGNTAICAGSGATLTANGATSYTWFTTMGTFTGSTIVLTPSATACYTLVGSNGPSCTGYASGCVSVSQGGNIAISGNASICSGYSTVLYASGGTSYTWQPGGSNANAIVVTPTATTCYTLFGYGCSGLGAAVRCVTVGSAPVVSISGNTAICAGSGATLTASGATSYTWMTGFGTFTGSTIVLTPSTTTCYSLIASNGSGSGCSVYTGGCINVSQGGNIAINGNASICSGNSTVLYASGGTSYTWQPGGSNAASIAVSPTATTCYTLFGTGCSGPGAAVKCVTVSPSPVVSISGNTAICSGSSATLSASGATSYTWMTAYGTFTGSTIVLTPSTTTCYSLVASNGGCFVYTGGCISVSPSGTVSISGNANICSGSTVLFASGGTSYTWMPGGSHSSSIVVTPSTGVTCYTLQGFSCSGLSYAVKCVTVGTSPIISISGNTAVCAGSSTTLTASGATSYTWYTGGGILTGSSIVITPSTSTCFSLAASNGPGCTTYTGVCVSVAPINNLLISGSSAVCAGSPVNLSASGATSYTWLPGNLTGSMITVTPSASICYTLVGTNANGCVSLAYKCIQVMPKPIITTGGGIFCAGNAGILNAQGATSYTWLPFNLTGSSIVITPSVSMCYTVIGSNNNGCTNSTVGCFSVMPLPSITVSGTSSICAGASATLSASGASSYTWLPSYTSGPNLVVTPSSSTCYTVVGINAFGCSSSALKCISVQQGAFLNVSGPNVICAGSSANLLAYGASTYTWNTGSHSPFITVSPTSPACYTVTGTTAQGCIGSAVKCLSVQPGPSIYIYQTDSVFNNDSIICAGNAVHLFASGANSYTWSTGSTSSYITVTPSVTTSYTVYGTNAMGCGNSHAITLYVSPCTGLAKNTGNLQITMYPNPSYGQLTLQGDGVNAISYSVLDVIGRELVKGEFTNSKQVDLSDYANGTYMIRFEMGNTVTYKKLILENK